MAKCCDRCEKPINPIEMAVIKFQFNIREFVRNIETAIGRKREGVQDYNNYHKTVSGKWELCVDCCEGLSEFMLRKG
jgi:hypothetical protein